MFNKYFIPRKLVHTTLVILVLALLNVSAENTFCASFLFINNSVTFSQLGSVNGLAVSLTSLTRYYTVCVCLCACVNVHVTISMVDAEFIQVN